MAFATIGTPVVSKTPNANAASLVVNLPTGITAGSLLVVQAVKRFVTAITWPAGWVEVSIGTSVSTAHQEVRYRVADGTEGASITLSVEAGSASRWVAHAWRIEGYADVPEAATVTGDSTNANPPNLAPSWGADDTLWMALVGWDGFPIASAGPANYTNFSQASETFVSSASALRELNAASENPGPYTSGTEQWVAATVAIRGAVAGAPTPTRTFLTLGVGA